MSNTSRHVSQLSNDHLLSRLRRLQGDSCALLGELLLFLGEVQARELYSDRGCDSMHVYCTEVLGMSDGAYGPRS